jgi:hypothetical protein
MVRPEAFFMPSDTLTPTAPATTGYRALLRNSEFAGLCASFTLTVAANTLSGFALGTLVNHQTHSPFLTANSIRLTRRPGLRQTWTTNIALFSHAGQRALLLNLWVPNGLIVGCEALFISYARDHAGALLAAGSAGMLIGDLTVGRLLTADQRWRYAFALRLLLAAPYLLFAIHPEGRGVPWPSGRGRNSFPRSGAREAVTPPGWNGVRLPRPGVARGTAAPG